MKRGSGVLVVAAVAWLGLMSSGLAVAGLPKVGISAIGFFPEPVRIAAFLSENGLPPLGEGLLGASGSVQLGGASGIGLGAMAWGIVASSTNEQLAAQIVSAACGLDAGRAIGGDEDSELSLGIVVGGGVTILSVHGYPYPTLGGDGFAPEPTRRNIVHAFALIQPYVRMAVDLIPRVGIELRIGYLWPLFGLTFGDILGIPAPSLAFSGPIVGLGLTYDTSGPSDDPQD